MTLIKSISGIRGTIGGKEGDNLTPLDTVKFTAAYAKMVQDSAGRKDILLVVGRDARISGKMIENLVVSTLSGMGANVINTGLSTTPTVEMTVIDKEADGGIIITASHNPKQWNALKLLNSKGEFISAAQGKMVLSLAAQSNFSFAPVNGLGKITEDYETIDKHIDKILKLDLVNRELIEKANFKIAVDGINSTGGIAIPQLLKALGVKDIIKLNCEPTGDFSHNPEPLPENLTAISKAILENKADLGIVVDPDVDRLAFVMENGEMFGEEYTLVAVADYVLQNKKGNTVSNLSSTRALRDITEKAGAGYFASAVGEVNVVEKMREVDAVIGGEGNGGVIYPDLHSGRDALVGTALFLTFLAKKNIKISQLRSTYPDYYISKNKISLDQGMNVKTLFDKVINAYSHYPVSTVDGVKIDFPDGWVHLRTSNTEPIIRIYAESTSPEKARKYAGDVISILKN
jgi:phosphomannomutase